MEEINKPKYAKGGGDSCAVHGCGNNRRKLHIWKNSLCELHSVLHADCPCLLPYSLHKMPNSEEVTALWKSHLNRKTLPKKVLACSRHFVDGCPTDRNPAPTLLLGYERKVTPGRRKLVKHDVGAHPKKVKLDFEKENQQPVPSEEDIEPTSTTALSEPEVHTEYRSSSTQWEDEDIFGNGKNDHTNYCTTSPYEPQRTISTQTCQGDSAEKGVQCDLEVGAMSCKKLLTDSDSLFYTGVPLTVFNTIVTVMEPLNNFPGGMDTGDQILIVLMRLKLNLLFEDISKRFLISRSLVSRIFNDWLPLLAEKLKELIVWLPRETIRACTPASFKTNFPKTTCIIDCAETFIQKPANLKSRSETYSQYKSHNTSKYLVGIAPHGQIMFISRAYGGRASDKFIVKDSGFLNYLLPGDEIMADRGFTIGDLLFPLRVKLNIPAFTRGKSQLSEEDVTSTRRIATVRIHVERAIRRLKVFKILSSVVSVSTVKHFDDILIVCAALVNLRSDLIKDV